MNEGIQSDMSFQLVDSLGRAPGFPEEAVDMRPEHRAGVIETKNGIPLEFFELSLAHHRSSSSKDGFMPSFWEILLNISWIMWV